MNILVFDNYDSFTYNLVHCIEKITGNTVDVFRNDAIELEAIERYDRIVLSPGPGLPREAGQLLPLIEQYGSTKHLLGVCLGHQAIAEAFGGHLLNLSTVHHGVSHRIRILDHSGIFKNLPGEEMVGRYHSWIVNRKSLPKDFIITAEDAEGSIMAMRHRQYKIESVQFHPESVLTPNGETMLYNWIKND